VAVQSTSYYGRSSLDLAPGNYFSPEAAAGRVRLPGGLRGAGPTRGAGVVGSLRPPQPLGIMGARFSTPRGVIPIMVDAPLPTTRGSLLARLRQDPTDQAGWDEFVEHYGRHIYRWCRRWKLQDADAEDVTQDILAKLARKLRTFAYDPAGSFRGWLKTVAHHAWRDFEAGRRHPQPAAGDSEVEELML